MPQRPDDRFAMIPVDHDPFGDAPVEQPPAPRPKPRQPRNEQAKREPNGAYRSKTVCVIDNGLFVELAVTLAKDFGTVLYYTPWELTFPKTNRTLLGDGIPGVARVQSFWPFLDEIDLFVFPDVNMGPLQLHLIALGKRVWGARMGEDLELDRDASKQHMAELGIDIGPYAVVTGITALREYLRENEKQYVKISRFRGDMESFRSTNYELIEPLLDELEHGFGAKKNQIEFIVEGDIPDAVEVGYDGFTIDGQFAENGTRGIEVKDRGFVMRSGPYSDIPQQLRDINTKLGPTFKELQYRGFFSTEARITKNGTAYVIDPCCRLPSPPSQLYWIMITNWSDILWEGAGGTVVEPDLQAKWGAELILTSGWAEKNWQPIEFPDEIRDNVRITNLSMIDGKYYFVPQDVEMPEIAGVAALGDTMDAAIKAVREIAEQVEGYGIETNSSALDAAKEQVDKLKEFGIEL